MGMMHISRRAAKAGETDCVEQAAKLIDALRRD
jgi:hypothetical protein